jgi:hypothetical protein
LSARCAFSPPLYLVAPDPKYRHQQPRWGGGQRRFNLPRPPDPTRGGGLELPLKVVQTGLGHASIQMTADTYGHLFPRGGDGAELAAAEKAFLGA